MANTLALQLGAVLNVEKKLEKIVKKKPEPATGKRRQKKVLLLRQAHQFGVAQPPIQPVGLRTRMPKLKAFRDFVVRKMERERELPKALA